MVSQALPLLTHFIPCVAKPFPCCPSALPGEKSVSSFLIRRLIRFAPCPRLGRASPCLILFWLLLLATLCYVGDTCSSLLIFCGGVTLSASSSTDLVHHLTPHHLTLLAAFFVRQTP